MQMHRIMKNDPEFVAGFSEAMDEVEYLIYHSDNPIVALRGWIERQSEIVDAMNLTRNADLTVVDKPGREGPYEKKTE